MNAVDQLREISQAYEAALAAKDAEIARLREALEGLRGYFLTHDWDEDSVMVEGINKALKEQTP